MVVWVKGYTITRTSGQDAGPLKGLLCRVVARLTQALKVSRIKEQHQVALVRFLVVRDVCCLVLTQGKAEDAQGVGSQLGGP